jgi:hypothetical protein
VDQELVEYLDRGFSRLRTELRVDIAASAAELRAEIASSTAELRAEIASSTAELRAEIATSADQLRRHFGVMTEDLMDKIKLVSEGVLFTSQKVDRLSAEMHAEFQSADRRILHLQARVIGLD